MSGRFLLDTNIVIALFQLDVSVQENLAKAEQENKSFRARLAVPTRKKIAATCSNRQS